ncbi:proteoglycan 4 [Nematostella vectensis]|uniref:proteoglycan 4 n=1 Tax=Nematostella vectensis TaxID=45351 RepID=UPI002076FECF|nr:proteoglycan 4 [Nematostella vectensis]
MSQEKSNHSPSREQTSSPALAPDSTHGASPHSWRSVSSWNGSPMSSRNTSPYPWRDESPWNGSPMSPRNTSPDPWRDESPWNSSPMSPRNTSPYPWRDESPWKSSPMSPRNTSPYPWRDESPWRNEFSWNRTPDSTHNDSPLSSSLQCQRRNPTPFNRLFVSPWDSFPETFTSDQLSPTYSSPSSFSSKAPLPVFVDFTPGDVIAPVPIRCRPVPVGDPLILAPVDDCPNSEPRVIPIVDPVHVFPDNCNHVILIKPEYAGGDDDDDVILMKAESHDDDDDDDDDRSFVSFCMSDGSDEVDGDDRLTDSLDILLNDADEEEFNETLDMFDAEEGEYIDLVLMEFNQFLADTITRAVKRCRSPTESFDESSDDDEDWGMRKRRKMSE